MASDLLDLELAEQVDAVFSNATFHWILEHERLFERLYAALRPGGRLEAQCGGSGTSAEFLHSVEAVSGDERFAPYLRAVPDTWNFASPGDTEVRLRGAGFEDVALLARAASRAAARATRVPADGLPGAAPRAAARRPPRAVPRRGAGGRCRAR